MIKNILLGIWQLPVALPIWLFYILPFWCIGAIRLIDTDEEYCLFITTEKFSWYSNWWKKWAGCALPFCIIVNQKNYFNYPHLLVIKHEREHVRQWQRWGPIFPIAYLISLILHGYKDNYFEKQAREAQKK